MKYRYILLLLFFISYFSYSQTLLGEWETYDDKTNEKKGLIEIYKSNDLYFAKIKDTYVSAKNAICIACKDHKKNQPIIGLVIIENLKSDKDDYTGGTILDPESGETYKCIVKLINNNKLKVRGYIGVPLFGRTQYWIRKK